MTFKLSRILFEQITDDIELSVGKIADTIIGTSRSASDDYEEDEEDSKTEELPNIMPSTEPSNQEIMEASKKPSEKDLFDAIIVKSGYAFAPMKKKKSWRLKPSDRIKENLTGDETPQEAKAKIEIYLKRGIEHALQGYEYEIIKPGTSHLSASGRYDTFLITDPATKVQITLVFAAGENAGHWFEKEAHKSVKDRRGEVWDKLTTFLREARGIDPDDIVDAELVGGRKVKRAFSPTVSDVGSLISDLNIKLRNGTVVYVSLKDKKGATFANPGYPNAFKAKQDVFGKLTVTATPPNSEIDKFLVDAIGVDKAEVAAGLQAYANKENMGRFDDVVPAKNPELLERYLAAQLGFGYVYMRRKPDGNFHLEDLKEMDDAMNMIGKIDKVQIMYPYYQGEGRSQKSKQCTINIRSSQGLYVVEIRNTGGEIVTSLQCNIRLIKYHGAALTTTSPAATNKTTHAVEDLSKFQISDKTKNIAPWLFK